MNRWPVIVAATLLASGVAVAAEPKLLFQKPTLSATQIAFVYAGDLWIVSREGGDARRLTAGAGVETRPYFSPDGKFIAFTGEYDGNVDVYVVAADGGVPRRLTWHPSPDQTMGWTPDGASILFSSRRASYSGFSRLFTVSRDGGFPSELPLPIAAEGSYSPDGSKIATSRSTTPSRCGSATAADAHLRSGSRSWPIPASRNCRAIIRTTSTPCGSTTGSSSSPTATVQ